MRCISWSLLFPDFSLARCLVTAESAWARMSSSPLLLGWWSRCNCCDPFSLVMGHSAAGSLRLALSPPRSRASWRLKDFCLLKSMLGLSVLDIFKCRSAVGLFCHHDYLIYKASTQAFSAFPVSLNVFHSVLEAPTAASLASPGAGLDLRCSFSDTAKSSHT